MVEDLAITKSTMDETTTIRKVQELPERLNTNQAMVEHQAVPNTLVDVTKTNPAMVEPQAVFPNTVDMINTIVKAQAGQPKPTGPAVGLSLNTAKVEYPASTPSLVDVTTTIVNVQEMPRKKMHSQQPSQAELTRLGLDKQRREKRLMRMSSSRNLSQAPRDPEPRPGANPKVTQLVSRFETTPSPIKMPRPPPTSTTLCRTSNAGPFTTIPTIQPSNSKTEARPVPGQRQEVSLFARK